MKKLRIVLVILVLVLIVSFVVYKYVYLQSGSCIQVMVSATSRITGKSEVFGNPCAVPFWYKVLTP